MLNRKQKELIPELEKRGVSARETDVSAALDDNLYETRPKWRKIRALSAEIVEEWKLKK